MYQIGEVAKLANVTVRLLRHYDSIGLLVPSGRGENGYRLYSRTDLQRLQQILFYRLLEFPLENILQVMNDPAFDNRTALLEQKLLLQERARDLDALLNLIDRTITELGLPEESAMMSNKAMFDAFPEMKQEYLAEAEQRWGDTEAFKQSRLRSASYTKEDWRRMKVEMEQVNAELEMVFKAGKLPSSPEAISAVEEARLLISRWHYNCSKDFHVNLTAMTCADERFVRNIDRNCPGLAAFIHAAAKANRNPPLPPT